MNLFHTFTSVTSNYIPKANVLAESIKKFHPNSIFHLVLSDTLSLDIKKLISDKIDSIILLENLPIDNLMSWIFKHDVVELCTAVKGVAFKQIYKDYKADKIIYLDPDTVVFNSLDNLTEKLNHNSVVLTPHFCKPQPDPKSIEHYEISVLKHGVYNLGFLGIRTSQDGLDFLDWWNERLINYCYDEIARGLFTDQKWMDLAPVFFDFIKILKEPNYNVAVWNLTQRRISGAVPDNILIDDLPLVFFHFTGFDKNVDIAMIQKYDLPRIVLELRKWYEQKLYEMGQQEIGSNACFYSFYNDGEKITPLQRMIYRNNEKLQLRYPNPFSTANDSFRTWFSDHYDINEQELYTPEILNDLPAETISSILNATINELNSLKKSKFWKLREAYWRFKRKLSIF
jgi:lipopolysaccharide biosynthesis glycosyltransferase